MGIPDLWDVIRDHEEVIPLTQLAQDHYRQHSRPLRIAVDEADWRFNNLTQAQVYAIRDSSGEQAFQGIEKAMFWRICRLLTLNIQLIVVFDGPGVPAKRGRNGGRRIDYEKFRLLKEVLRCFGIPYQEASGEAEAECARLQILGLAMLKENTKKSGKTVRIVRASVMKEKLSMSRESFVLFAMLAGGDYNEVGLRGCGAATALSAAKDETLAQSLCLCRNQRDCTEWSYRLAVFLRAMPRARNLHIPGNFPDYKILQKYYRPKVTSDELLMEKKSLDLSNPRSIDEIKLLGVTSTRFNIWGRLYMNWVGPVLLSRSLLRRGTAETEEIVHGIKFTKQRASKDEGTTAMRSLQRKITFSPFGVTTLRREHLEGGEREGMWEGKKDVPFDPTYRVECDYFRVFVLRQALPADIIDLPSPAPKQKSSKRKEHPEVDIGGGRSIPPTRKQKKSAERGITEASKTVLGWADSSCGRQVDSGRRAQRYSGLLNPSRPNGLRQLCTGPREVIDLSESGDDLELRLPPARKIKVSSSIQAARSEIVDLGSPEPSEVEDEGLAPPSRFGLQLPHTDRSAHTALQKAPSSPQTLQNVRPLSRSTTLEAFDSVSDGLHDLGRIRTARLIHFASTHSLAVPQHAMPSTGAGQPASATATEVIDLTGD